MVVDKRRSSASSANAQSTTVRGAISRAASSTNGTADGRTSGHRSAREMPVSSRRSSPKDQHRAVSAPRSSWPEAARRHAPASPGDSSSRPKADDTTPPYTSASMSSVGTDWAAASTARFVASRVRPGAPVGPQTATTDPRAGGPSGI